MGVLEVLLIALLDGKVFGIRCARWFDGLDLAATTTGWDIIDLGAHHLVDLHILRILCASVRKFIV